MLRQIFNAATLEHHIPSYICSIEFNSILNYAYLDQLCNHIVGFGTDYN